MKDVYVNEAPRVPFGENLEIDPARAAGSMPDTPLFDVLPELDSMAAAHELTAIDDGFGIVIDDEHIAQHLASFGALVQEVRHLGLSHAAAVCGDRT